MKKEEKKSMTCFEVDLLEIMGKKFESKFDYVEAGLKFIETSPKDFQIPLLETLITMHDSVPKVGKEVDFRDPFDNRWDNWINKPGFVKMITGFCEYLRERNIPSSEMAQEVWDILQDEGSGKMSEDEKVMFLAVHLYGDIPLANYVQIRPRLTDDENKMLSDDMKPDLMWVHELVTNGGIHNYPDMASAILERLDEEKDPKRKIMILSKAFKCFKECLGSSRISVKTISSSAIPLGIGGIISSLLYREDRDVDGLEDELD